MKDKKKVLFLIAAAGLWLVTALFYGMFGAESPSASRPGPESVWQGMAAIRKRERL